MSVYFVAGSGTDVGKTYVTAELVRRLREAGRAVQALKPVASGVASLDDPAFAASDTAVLLEAQGLEVTPQTVDACTPWRFRAPLSPDMAAAAEGRALPAAEVAAWIRGCIAAAAPGTVTLVEGVGGVMSPMAEDALNLDLIKAVACPVILVGGSYLGALTHTLTALETLKAHGVALDRVVLNETRGSTVGFEATAATLARFAGGIRLTCVRYGGTLELD